MAEWITNSWIVEKLSKGELSKDDYPCTNDPSPTFHGISQAASIHEAPVAHPMRSRRTLTWTRPRGSDDGYSRSWPCICSNYLYSLSPWFFVSFLSRLCQSTLMMYYCFYPSMPMRSGMHYLCAFLSLMLFLGGFNFNVCFPTTSQWSGTKTCIKWFQDGQTHFCVYSGWGYKIWGMKNLRSPSPRPWGYELMMIDIFDTPLKCLHVQLRICHKLTGKLNREVVLGSTSLDDPPQFYHGSDFSTTTIFSFYLAEFFHS